MGKTKEKSIDRPQAVKEPKTPKAPRSLRLGRPKNPDSRGTRRQ